MSRPFITPAQRLCNARRKASIKGRRAIAELMRNGTPTGSCGYDDETAAIVAEIERAVRAESLRCQTLALRERHRQESEEGQIACLEIALAIVTGETP